jgi:hypothetical protein
MAAAHVLYAEIRGLPCLNRGAGCEAPVPYCPRLGTCVLHPPPPTRALPTRALSHAFCTNQSTQPPARLLARPPCSPAGGALLRNAARARRLRGAHPGRPRPRVPQRHRHAEQRLERLQRHVQRRLAAAAAGPALRHARQGLLCSAGGDVRTQPRRRAELLQRRCVRACVRACMRACVRACVRACGQLGCCGLCGDDCCHSRALVGDGCVFYTRLSLRV